jgi:hypothetical protein
MDFPRAQGNIDSWAMLESCVSIVTCCEFQASTPLAAPRIADLVLRKILRHQFRYTKYRYYENLMARANIPDPLTVTAGQPTY